MDSSATSLVAASASCTSFDSLRIHRPNTAAPRATTGTTDSAIIVRYGDTQNSMTTPPITPIAKRSPIETLTVTVFCSTDVSAARRLVSSPVRLASKKPISWWRTESNRSRRRSATTRSPASVNHHARAAEATACSAKTTTNTPAAWSNRDRSLASTTRSTIQRTTSGNANDIDELISNAAVAASNRRAWGRASSSNRRTVTRPSDMGSSCRTGTG